MRNAHLRIIIGCLLALVGGAALHAQTPPPADQVFQLRVAPGAAGALVLNWTIAPGNYLYRDKIAVKDSGGSAIEVTTDRERSRTIRRSVRRRSITTGRRRSWTRNCCRATAVFS